MEKTELKSHGTKLRYECGLARKFYDEILEETYDERFMTCNFNKSWTEFDILDPCIWVQCLYPPEPPAGTNLKLLWDGAPVNFTNTVSYVCKEDNLYFEWDKEMPEYTVACMPGGTWDAPKEWPRCLNCKTTDKIIQAIYAFFPFFSC